MFLLKYSHLRSPSFHQALRKLANHPFKDVKSLYNVTRIVKLVQQEGKQCDELFLKVLKGYADLDEKGEIKPINPTSPNTFSVPDSKKEEWEKAAKDFHEIEVKFERHKVTPEECVLAGLTANDMVELDPMLSELSTKPDLAVVK